MYYNSTTLYNPSEKNKGQLIEEFVVRVNTFKRVFNDIKTSDGLHPEQHYLIVGQRGAGKTTLMYRLKYAIEDDPNLKKKLIPFNLGEEQYSISELNDLWEVISEILDDHYGYTGLSLQLKKIRDSNDSESRSWELISSQLESKKQSIVLFIDNFGDLLKKFSDKDVRRLRQILIVYKSIRLIAGTPYTPQNIFMYSEPFFEFFKIIHLKGLTKDETIKLLRKLGHTLDKSDMIENVISEKVERIEILRRLTGGVIRTMVLLFKVFIENSDGRAISDLRFILDSVTPLYKHRMDDLPAQQQKIIDAVARNWDAIGVKEIAKASRISSKNVSAQLRQLEKNQLIEKIQTESKNHLYHLKERFFNIWYLMRYGKKYDKNKVLWLVRFLESWCNKKKLERRVKNHIENLSSTEKFARDSALFIGKAYLACGVPEDDKLKLIDTMAAKYPDLEKTKYDLSVEEPEILYKKRDQTEKQFLNAIEKGDKYAGPCLAIFYLIEKREDKKEFALELIKKGQRDIKEKFLSEWSSRIYLWNKDYQAAFKDLEDLVNDREYLESQLQNITDLLIDFISLQLYYPVLKLFNEEVNELKILMKPLYYSLMTLMKDDFPKEYLKMGNELTETVNEILQEIDKRSVNTGSIP